MKFRTILQFGLAGTLGVSAIQAQTVEYNPGDLLVGFHATGGTGAAQAFVFNAGATVDFRDQNIEGVIFNLNDVLASIYGADWFARTDIFWGAAGVRSNRNPNPPFGAAPEVVDGDPSATLYLSRPTAEPQGSSPWRFDTTGQMLTAAGSIRGLADLGQQASGAFSFQPAAPGTDNRGAIVQASLENSWATYNPQPGAAFDVLVGGVESALGSDGDQSYVDLYRVLTTTVGADPTGEARVGTWIATLVLDSAGNLSVVYGVERYWWEGQAGLVEIGNGWYELPWLGFFAPYMDFAYVAGQGWWFVTAGEGDALYAYDYAADLWIMTTPAIYPWVYKFGENADWVELN